MAEREPESYRPETRAMQFGDVPLKTSEPMNRWRREAEETKRAQEQERERREQEHQRIIRQRQQEAVRAGIAAFFEEQPFTDRQRDILAMVIAEERSHTLRPEIKAAIDTAELRAEFRIATAKTIDEQVIEMPNPIVRKVRNNAA